MSIHTRGFASMDPAKRREIARRGGKAVHAQGKAHEWDSAEARAASLQGKKNQRRKRGVELPQDAETPTPAPYD